MTNGKAWDRRDFMGAATLLALVVGVPVATIKLSDLDEREMPSDRQVKLISEVADLVIPKTDTPGAGELGVGNFVVLALAHGLLGTKSPVASGAITPALAPYRRQDGSLRHLEWLEHTLDRAVQGDFLRASAAKRVETLAALDATSMARGAAWSPWPAIKGLILTGYYTTETGASKELRYELVPGRYEPDLPMAPGDRAFSSDWTAVEFG